jgi:hypothetical protein
MQIDYFIEMQIHFQVKGLHSPPKPTYVFMDIIIQLQMDLMFVGDLAGMKMEEAYTLMVMRGLMTLREE